MKKILGVVIVLLAVGAAIPSTRARMLDAMSPLRERFRKKIVPGRLEVLADQVDARLGLGQGFPSDFDNWLRRTFTGLPDDPWGNLYYLDTRSRRSYKVGSMGPDQKRGTEDDITVERPLRN